MASEPKAVGRVKGSWRWMLVLAAAGFLLSWPALWNGAPLVFFDSGGYLSRADAAVKFISGRSESLNPRSSEKGDLRADRLETDHGDRRGASRSISTNPFFWRPIFYSVWLVPFATALTFGLIALGQGVLAAYVIRRLMVTLGLQSFADFGIVIGVLAAVSSLPWHVSYVMPDVFTGLLIAQSFVLVYGWSQRSWLGRVFDAGLITLMVAVHLSHLPLALGLILVFAFGGLILKRDLHAAIRAGGGLLAMLIAVAFAVTGLIASNLVGAHKATLSESSPLFVMSRLAADGTALDYLKQACPTKHYLACDPDAGTLVNLWAPDSVLERKGSPRLLAEAVEINAGTLHLYPWREAGHMLANTARQFATFQTDPSLLHPPPAMVIEPAQSIDPDFARRLRGSVQARSAFPIDALNLIQDLALGLSLLVAGWTVWTARRRLSGAAWQFAAVAFLGILGNAMVTGGLSSVNERYQHRVIWLVVLAATTLVLAAWRSAREPSPRA